MSAIAQTDTAVDALPWQRQAGESAAHFKLFQAYLELGWGRDTVGVAEVTKRSYDHVRRVAKACGWSDRADAFDNHLLEQFADKWIERSLKSFERDEALLRQVRVKCLEAVRNLDTKAPKFGDVARLVDVLLRQSRALYGTPVQTLAGADAGDEGDEVTGSDEQRKFAEKPKDERDRILAEMRKALGDRSHARSGRDDE